jgi:hypothetical protein
LFDLKRYEELQYVTFSSLSSTLFAKPEYAKVILQNLLENVNRINLLRVIPKWVKLSLVWVRSLISLFPNPLLF